MGKCQQVFETHFYYRNRIFRGNKKQLWGNEPSSLLSQKQRWAKNQGKISKIQLPILTFQEIYL
jgi:hypothetical protein